MSLTTSLIRNGTMLEELTFASDGAGYTSSGKKKEWYWCYDFQFLVNMIPLQSSSINSYNNGQ